MLRAYIYNSILTGLYPQALGPLSIQISMFQSTFGEVCFMYTKTMEKEEINYMEKYIIQPHCREK